jgi:VWFA-related protein
MQVDVLVTDAEGNPVTDLTLEDFEVLEGGRSREISTFASVLIPIEPPPVVLEGDAIVEPDVATNTTPQGRTYLIALDEVGPDRALRARAFLKQFIDRYMGPHDVAAVSLLGRGLSTSGQDFTSSKRLIMGAIDKFSGGFSDVGRESSAISTSDPRQLAASLRKVTEFLATMPGRKVLLYVGEGLGGIDAFDVVDYRGGALTPAGIDAHEAIAAATRGNVTIYPVDPRGLTTDLAAAESFDTSHLDARTDLAAIADVTGGFAVTNTNNLPDAFERLVRENSAYYTLGFISEGVRQDGRFVRLDVRVKRPGLVARSRTGYVSPLGRDRRPEPVESDTRFAVVADAIASPVATTGVGMRVFAAPFRSQGDKSSIAVVVEIDPKTLGFTTKDGVLTSALEVSYLATDAKGKVLPGRRHSATLTFKADAMEKAFAEGVRVLSEFELPDGRYQLRVAAGSPTNAGSVIYDLDVPDFGKGPLAMSGLALTSAAASKVTTIRPREALADALPAPPVALREFALGDTLMLFAEVYDNAGGRSPTHAIEVTTELRAEDGTLVARSSEAREAGSPTRKSGGHGFNILLPLQDISPGWYVVKVEARSRRDMEHTASRSVRIRVK